jgi:hypothetical protein
MKAAFYWVAPHGEPPFQPAKVVWNTETNQPVLVWFIGDAAAYDAFQCVIGSPIREQD